MGCCQAVMLAHRKPAPAYVQPGVVRISEIEAVMIARGGRKALLAQHCIEAQSRTRMTEGTPQLAPERYRRPAGPVGGTPC
jgi:hypothetical protein